ncbi:MAG: EAL domain-containing protein, partial [Lachnospiraceae bacterium]|nr:EAL domain-containing protein [Lachnospiraceae bacterium]
MIAAEYNLKEMESFLAMSRGLYDIVRLVDPMECREITIEDGHLKFLDGCFNVWDSGKRCKTCSSFKACRSGSRIEKRELFENNVYNILSNPIRLTIQDGSTIDCVIEFITSHEATKDEIAKINDRQNENIEPAVLLDPLTGVYNADGFFQKARKLINKNTDRHVIIAAFDISKFKLVNSLYGHQKGDDILLNVARILKHFSPDEAVTGRMQSDQFALCIYEDALDKEYILNELATINNIIDSNSFTLEILIGLYDVVDRELPVSAMYDRAVMAYISGFGAKEKQYITRFDETLMDELLYQQSVVNNFHKNLEAGEFNIFIQPQVDNNCRVYGGEALCRWIKPGEGIIPPYKFIPILEKSGLIAKLDAYVWDLAAKQLFKWKDTEFSDLYISVNISPLDFYYIDVYTTLVDIVKKYDIDRHKL